MTDDEGRYIPDEIPKSFWELIDKSDSDSNVLRGLLNDMTAQDIVKFYWNYCEAVEQIKPYYFELCEYSEDSVDELCHWVVAQGEKTYRFLWDEPEEAILNPESDVYGLKSDPGFVSEAIRVYREKENKDLPFKDHEEFVE